MRIKALPPTLREKKRYMAVYGMTWDDIRDAFQRWFGRFYASVAHLRKIEENKDYTIIQVNRDYDWMLRASVALSVPKKDPAYVIRESGTLKRLREKMGSSTNNE